MKKKNLLLTLLLALLAPWTAQAQTLADYTFSTGNDASKWVNVTSTTSLLVNGGDSQASSTLNIGFNFPFGENTYEKFSVNTDGNLRLGNTATGTSAYSTPFSSSYANSNNPKINAFGCDGKFSSDHYVKYQNESDKLVVEFCAGTYTSSTSSKLYKWQVHLYTNGDIEIVFPDASGIPDTGPATTHQCGLCMNSSDGWIITSTDNTATHFTSGSSTYNASGTWFDANRYYRFEAPVLTCFKPQNLAATLTPGDGSIATLNWQRHANGTENAWVLQVATDDAFTANVQNIPVSNTPSKDLTGLTAEQTYYARVKPDCDTDGTLWSNVCEFKPTDAYTVTLNDGTNTNTYVPIHGSYCDYGNRCQFIIPAASLSTLQWATLDKLTFYADANVTSAFNGAVFKVYMAEVSNTVFESQAFVDWTTLSTVYNGSLVWSGKEWVFTLDASNPFTYQGGNLLIGFQETSFVTDGTYATITWLGVNQTTNTAISQYANSSHSWSGTITYRQFLPKVTIDYTPGTAPSCLPPTGLAVVENSITAHGVAMQWDSESGAVYNYAIVKGTGIDPETVTYAGSETASGTTCSHTWSSGLDGDSDYTVFIRKDCGNGDYSTPATKIIHTEIACPAPTDLACTAFTATTASFSWTAGASESGWVLQYGTDNTFAAGTYTEITTGFNTQNAPTISFNATTGITAETVHYARVQAACGGIDGSSDWSNTVSFEPSAKQLITGETTGTNSNLPSNTNYDFSYTQQIYTVAELGTAGIIESIDFYMTSTSDYTRSLDVYMVATDKNSFTGNSDWINVSAADLVFSGSVAFIAQSWTTITLDEPFLYDGSQNVAIIVDDNTDAWSSRNFSTFTAEANQSLYASRDDTNINPSAPSGSFAFNSVTTAKNQIRILKSALPNCIKPTGLTATVIDGHNVTLSWKEIGSATAWEINKGDGSQNVSINDQTTGVTFDGTNVTYTLGGLTAETTYSVTVRANCGGTDGDSDWSNPVSFTTDVACPAPTLQPVSGITNNSATISWTGSEAGSFNVRYRKQEGTWQTPYDSPVSTNSITITGLDDETLYEVEVQANCGNGDGESVWVGTTFTTLSNCSAPNELYVTELTNNSAKLNWTGAQTVYNVRYRKAAEEGETTEDFSEQTAVGWSDTNGELPSGWYSYTTGTHAPRVSNYSSYSFISALTDNYLLMTTNGTGQSTYAIMPQYSGITGVSFNYAFESDSNCGNLEVGYVTDNTGHSTFTRLGDPIAPENTSSNSYSLSSTDIATLNSINGYIAFKYNSNNSTYYSAAIDDVVVTTQTTPAGAWNTDNHDVNSELTINNLTQNTKYEWQVQGINASCTNSDNETGLTDWSEMASFTTFAQFTKTIDAVDETVWAEGKGGYYLIASPLADDVDPSTIAGMIPSSEDYDLYAFNQDEDLEWRNYKASSFDLVNGQGYLYANKSGVTLTFTGVPYSGNGEVTLSMTDDNTVDFQGWNLVGNPFGEDATIDRDCYVMNEEGRAEIIATESRLIPAMEGAFVIAESGEDAVSFTVGAKGGDENNSKLVLNLTKNNGLLDRAIVRFSEGRQLPKFQLNPSHTKVFIPQEGKDYAIVSTESNVGEMPVSFKAEHNGSYTMNFTTEEVTFNYLHLIDNKTGNDVNLLETPYYTFEANTSDYESRFRLVFATGSSVDDNNFGFVNASGNFCIFGIEGEATVQVIDVLGHVLSNEQFSGSYERALNVAPGVYVIRLIQGNDIKVQKMVVR